MCFFFLMFFFFSSRRRHTRSYGDWSSDVCSSDLLRRSRPRARSASERSDRCLQLRRRFGRRSAGGEVERVAEHDLDVAEIGRASCRERVESWGGAGTLEKKRRREGE